MTVRDELERVMGAVLISNRRAAARQDLEYSVRVANEFFRDHGPALLEALDRPTSSGVLISEGLAKYLYGSGALDGTWFGDHNPNKKPYWWRDELGKAIDQARHE
jgi:hypothetical protein